MTEMYLKIIDRLTKVITELSRENAELKEVIASTALTCKITKADKKELIAAIKCHIKRDCNNCPYNHLACVGRNELLLKWILEYLEK